MLNKNGASEGMQTGAAMPQRRRVKSGGKKLNEIGAICRVQTTSQLPQPQEAMKGVRTTDTLPSAETIAQLVRHQRVRRFCIKSQSRCDRSIESFIVSGWRLDNHGDLSNDELKAMLAPLFKRAGSVRSLIEKGKPVEIADNRYAEILPQMIAVSAQGRKTWDDMRESTEKQMVKLAVSLPVAEWVKSVRGFGEKGLAIIIGETGDLLNYATKERVWKRLGLAVIAGNRQGRPGPNATSETWKEHGYSPQRRSEIWTLADSLFRAQWAGKKDEIDAHAIGPYGAVYSKRRAWTQARVDASASLSPKDPEYWSAGRAKNDAVRIMMKALLEDLWRVWNGKGPLHVNPPHS